MHIHLNLGHIIKKAATLITAGVAGFAAGGPVGAGTAMSVAASHLAKDGLVKEVLHHLKPH